MWTIFSRYKLKAENLRLKKKRFLEWNSWSRNLTMADKTPVNTGEWAFFNNHLPRLCTNTAFNNLLCLFAVFVLYWSFIIMKRAKDQFSCFYFFTTSVFDENDIPGSVLDMNKLSSYRVDELKFWLSCRGDSLKNLSTKAACIQRYFKEKILCSGSPIDSSYSFVWCVNVEPICRSKFAWFLFSFLHCLE